MVRSAESFRGFLYGKQVPSHVPRSGGWFPARHLPPEDPCNKPPFPGYVPASSKSVPRTALHSSEPSTACAQLPSRPRPIFEAFLSTCSFGTEAFFPNALPLPQFLLPRSVFWVSADRAAFFPLPGKSSRSLETSWSPEKFPNLLSFFGLRRLPHFRRRSVTGALFFHALFHFPGFRRFSPPFPLFRPDTDARRPQRHLKPVGIFHAKAYELQQPYKPDICLRLSFLRQSPFHPVSHRNKRRSARAIRNRQSMMSSIMPTVFKIKKTISIFPLRALRRPPGTLSGAF